MYNPQNTRNAKQKFVQLNIHTSLTNNLEKIQNCWQETTIASDKQVT